MSVNPILAPDILATAQSAKLYKPAIPIQSDALCGIGMCPPFSDIICGCYHDGATLTPSRYPMPNGFEPTRGAHSRDILGPLGP